MPSDWFGIKYTAVKFEKEDSSLASNCRGHERSYRNPRRHE